jgi:hypothetical protein
MRELRKKLANTRVVDWGSTPSRGNTGLMIMTNLLLFKHSHPVWCEHLWNSNIQRLGNDTRRPEMWCSRQVNTG